jgi:Concanavalin A-like lectin/glucanases superfamily
MRSFLLTFLLAFSLVFPAPSQGDKSWTPPKKGATPTPSPPPSGVGDTVTGLTHNWKFDDTTGTTALESIGGTHGVLMGGPVWVPAGGISGGALQVDGVDDYVVTGLSPGLPTGDFTVSVWTLGSAGAGGLFGIRNTGNTNELTMSASANYSLFVDGQQVLANSPTGVVADRWHLETVTRAGDDVSVYTDGGLAYTRKAAGTLAFGNCPVYLGANPAGNSCAVNNATGYFLGYLDDFRIYNRALSAVDVAKLYTDFATTPQGTMP